MDISVLGIDIAKSVFHLVGINERGKEVYRKHLKRRELLNELANMPLCVIAMEACGSSNYWAREMKKLGFEVKLIAAQHVKAYLKTNKNDWKDAAAIAEAASRESMHFVTPKSLYQQDLQCLHRVRTRMLKDRTALCNMIRGFLGEYGVVMAQGKKRLNKELSLTLLKEREKLTDVVYGLMLEMKKELEEKDLKIKDIESKLQSLSMQSEAYSRLLKVDGVGPITASAIISTVGSAADFENGRHFSAWIGLVPRQYTTGGKPHLLGISKRGDSYLRSLLIQGARVSVMFCKGKEDPRNQWVASVCERRGKQKASVALANKNARTIWAMLAYGTEFTRQQQDSYRAAA